MKLLSTDKCPRGTGDQKASQECGTRITSSLIVPMSCEFCPGSAVVPAGVLLDVQRNKYNNFWRGAEFLPSDLRPLGESVIKSKYLKHRFVKEMFNTKNDRHFKVPDGIWTYHVTDG